MKALKFLSFLFALTMSMAFVSCDQSNEPGNGEVIGGDYETGVWYEDGNKLIYIIEYDFIVYKYTAQWTLTFDGDICVKSECANKFSDATFAEIFYEECLAAGEKATKSGNTVTIDWTEVHAGLSKEELKQAIAYM